MSKHTPGTWTASCDRDDIDEANVILAGDTVIAYVFESPELRKRHRHGKIEGPGSTVGPDTLDEVDANARLMAASLEMRAVIYACIRELELWEKRQGFMHLGTQETLGKARAAIAKAEGEAK